MIDDARSLAERRSLERFSLRAPARVQAVLEDGVAVQEVFTRDISSGGAYLSTDNPLPEGARFEIAVLLSLGGFASLPGHPGTVKATTRGKVVRSGTDGMAVTFPHRWSMSPGGDLSDPMRGSSATA